MRKFLSIGIIFALVSPACFAMNMSLSDTCGFDTKYLQVQIWSPPGGFAKVNPDKTIAFPSDIPKGTMLLLSVNSSYCEIRCGAAAPLSCIPRCEADASMKIVGSWTPAKNKSVLPVQCGI